MCKFDGNLRFPFLMLALTVIVTTILIRDVLPEASHANKRYSACHARELLANLCLNGRPCNKTWILGERYEEMGLLSNRYIFSYLKVV